MSAVDSADFAKDGTHSVLKYFSIRDVFALILLQNVDMCNGPLGSESETNRKSALPTETKKIWNEKWFGCTLPYLKKYCNANRLCTSKTQSTQDPISVYVLVFSNLIDLCKSWRFNTFASWQNSRRGWYRADLSRNIFGSPTHTVVCIRYWSAT